MLFYSLHRIFWKNICFPTYSTIAAIARIYFTSCKPTKGSRRASIKGSRVKCKPWALYRQKQYRLSVSSSEIRQKLHRRRQRVVSSLERFLRTIASAQEIFRYLSEMLMHVAIRQKLFYLQIEAVGIRIFLNVTYIFVTKCIIIKMNLHK